MSYEDDKVKISARITKCELSDIKKHLKNQGVTIAEYIRYRLFGRKPIVPIGEPLQDDESHIMWMDVSDGIHKSHQKEVVKLCDRLGYGYVMNQASQAWQSKSNGALMVGPCKKSTKKCGCKDRVNCKKCRGCGWVIR